MTTAGGFTRRDFLAAAGAVPFGRGLGRLQPPGPLPGAADVVVIGGDAAACAAVFRLAQDAAVRVVLVDEDLPWARPSGPAEDTAVADLPPFTRGHQGCFDGWRDRGNPGWGFADVLPAFKRIETYEAGASETRGGDGPLSVKHCWDPHAAHRAFLMAAGPAGFRQDSRHDFNGPRSQSVAGYYQKAMTDDRPHTFTAAFLAPLRGRATVSLVTGGHVSRLVIERGRAVGLEYVVGGARHLIRAERSVILGAGPARAAQLLMLSGIGPADQLRALGVPVVVDRAGVGGNLHDQLRLPLRYAALQELPASTVSAGMFTVSLSASPPDLQMDLVTPRAGGPRELGLDVTLVRPSSRGTMTLASADPRAAPRLSLNPLATDADVTALVQGLRLAPAVHDRLAPRPVPRGGNGHHCRRPRRRPAARPGAGRGHGPRPPGRHLRHGPRHRSRRRRRRHAGRARRGRAAGGRRRGDARRRERAARRGGADDRRPRGDVRAAERHRPRVAFVRRNAAERA